MAAPDRTASEPDQRLPAQGPAVRPHVSVVMPASNGAERITLVLDLLFDSVRRPAEVLVVVDTPADPAVRALAAYAATEPRLTWLVNGYGTGLASAIRFGMDRAGAPVIVVTRADGSDDPMQIDELAALVEAGAAVAAASGRGRPPGGMPRRPVKPGLRDATDSFRAYSADFVRAVGVNSRCGCGVGLELTAKASRLRLPVAELPPTWRDRRRGRTGIRSLRWLPHYLRWYLFCLGRPVPAGRLPGRDRIGETAAVAPSPAVRPSD